MSDFLKKVFHSIFHFFTREKERPPYANKEMEINKMSKTEMAERIADIIKKTKRNDDD